MSSIRKHARAVAEAMFLRDEGPIPAARLDWVSDDFIDFIELAGPRSGLIIGGALQLATWVAPLAIRRRPPLARLSVEERCRALETLEKTPAGLPLLALKAIMCTIYYEHDDSKVEIGITRAAGDPLAQHGAAKSPAPIHLGTGPSVTEGEDSQS